jgi:hypothetical protein
MRPTSILELKIRQNQSEAAKRSGVKIIQSENGQGRAGDARTPSLTLVDLPSLRQPGFRWQLRSDSDV